MGGKLVGVLNEENRVKLRGRLEEYLAELFRLDVVYNSYRVRRFFEFRKADSEFVNKLARSVAGSNQKFLVNPNESSNASFIRHEN